MAGRLEMLHERDGETAIVSPTGRVDSLTAPALRAALATLDAAGERRIVIDLGGVTYISSAGLGVLFSLAKRMRETGGALALCSLGDQVRRVFELAGYLQHFTVAATRAEAVARVGGGS
jgi:stage II sporulation protein AA (anti-sigma F factor antagonist)